MTLALYGLPVSRGIAIGKVYVLSRGDLDVAEYAIAPQEVEQEVTRFQQAVSLADEQLQQVLQHIPSSTPLDIRSFIDTHLLMLNDRAISQVPIDIIKERCCNAEWALKLQRDALVKVFDAMDDAYLRTRQDDVDYVVSRIQRILLNHSPNPVESGAGGLKDTIILADDLSPADTVLMQNQGVAAFVTEYGGTNSHTAILARSLGIPALVGVHDARRYLNHGEQVVVDGRHGALLAGTDDTVFHYYQTKHYEDLAYRSTLEQLREQPAVTQDGHKIDMLANVELPEDLVAIERFGAEGIGLFRTEMLFLNKDRMPDEQEQFEEYLKVVQAAKGSLVVIRTLDVGCDKAVAWSHHVSSAVFNPALSLRGVRLSLREAVLFKAQLRAILRASAYGPVAIMVPMLSNIHEARHLLTLIAESKAELHALDIAYDVDISVGGMIEVPAVALIASELARYLDFLSIGTNDLIQYAIAADRIDDSVNYLYDPLHPGVLRLIQMIIEAGNQAKIPVSMCGEMAGDIRYTRLLMGLGLKTFSMHPAFLLEVKRRVNTSNFEQLRDRVNKAMLANDTFLITALVEELNRDD